ncbi:MAG: DUF3307 domain-containing protein [Thermoanaerobaculia bacterium]
MGTTDLGVLFALLVAGHTAGDFVLQTRRMALGKGRPRWLLAHAATVTGAHLACLAPVWSGPVILVALGVGVLHGLVDAAKTRMQRVRAERSREAASEQRPERFWLFATDQIVHLLILAGAAWLMLRVAGRPWFPDLARMADIRPGAWLLAAYAFNVNGSSSVVRTVLRRFTAPEGETDQPGAGRIIGVLERLMALTLVLLDQWGALGLVLAAKSIARFKDLDQRLSAEYYLVGTLTSLLLAVGSGLLLRLVL